uniref:PPM-type phosphatase domain-containing protein n=1 Tax=Sexangularia sp. CB-2014 TaxID=1486929 RepID=A0A7S1VKQ1_9EUKA|mmetsp:Transcript_5542/g.17978  ORF Transcript_5542/g.17978 Transcript_5542/m.17978 type:complete len:619 (+) Transcript_5542:166-2022(+)
MAEAPVSTTKKMRRRRLDQKIEEKRSLLNDSEMNSHGLTITDGTLVGTVGATRSVLPTNRRYRGKQRTRRRIPPRSRHATPSPPPPSTSLEQSSTNSTLIDSSLDLVTPLLGVPVEAGAGATDVVAATPKRGRRVRGGRKRITNRPKKNGATVALGEGTLTPQPSGDGTLNDESIIILDDEGGSSTRRFRSPLSWFGRRTPSGKSLELSDGGSDGDESGGRSRSGSRSGSQPPRPALFDIAGGTVNGKLCLPDPLSRSLIDALDDEARRASTNDPILPFGHDDSRCEVYAAAAGPNAMQGSREYHTDFSLVRSRRYNIGVAATTGRRFTSEDRLLVEGCFRTNATEDLIAVFDGHGGDQAADIACKFIPLALNRTLQTTDTIPEALVEVFAEAQEKIRTAVPSVQSGTTAVVAYFSGGECYLANAGDSRAVLISKPHPVAPKRNSTLASLAGRVRPPGASGSDVPTRRLPHALRMTTDHKPSEPRELARIEAAGGFVRQQYTVRGPISRVCGILAVARALGDIPLTPCVSAVPDITTFPTRHAQALVLACDGLFDVVTDAEVGAVVMRSLRAGETAGDAARTLRNLAFQRFSEDNISVIVVFFPAEAYSSGDEESSGK